MEKNTVTQGGWGVGGTQRSCAGACLRKVTSGEERGGRSSKVTKGRGRVRVRVRRVWESVWECGSVGGYGRGRR